MPSGWCCNNGATCTLRESTEPGSFGPTQAIRVTVTPKYVQTFGPPSSETYTKVCVGTFTLDHIDNYTEPAEMMGAQVSQVEATVRQSVDLQKAAWTKDAQLGALLQYWAPPATRKQKYILVLKNSGWAVDSLYPAAN